MKTLLLFVSCLICVNIFSQEKHIEFRGVPLNEGLNSFVQKMKTKGYKTIYSQKNAVVMEGEFINKKANIYILSTPKTNIVWKVGISFEKEISWSSLKFEYKNAKESYTQKYGKPLHFEYFTDPYEEGDGYELQALRMEKCTYESYFEIPEGMIVVKMNSDGGVGIAYEDKINAIKASEEKENAIMNEI